MPLFALPLLKSTLARKTHTSASGGGDDRYELWKSGYLATVLIWSDYPLKVQLLGKGGATKSDEFSEKFQTAFDPRSPHFRKIIFHFFQNGYSCIYERSYEGQIV